MIKAHTFAIVGLVAAVFAGRETGLYPHSATTAGTVLAMLAGFSMFAAVTLAENAGLTRREEG